jgi:hypothetical protein
MINLRAHPLLCPHCHRTIPDASGDFLSHTVRGFAVKGESPYLICPHDTQATKNAWVFVNKENKKEETMS